MKMNSTVGFVLLGVAVMAAIIVYGVIKGNQPSPYDEFAQCITDNGGQMYGAYWCHNCSNTKERFGSAFKYIDYTECSSPGSNSFDLCPQIGQRDADGEPVGPQGVPLWTRPDGEFFTGDAPLTTIAEFYSCELPE